jgi:hypothetical protein
MQTVTVTAPVDPTPTIHHHIYPRGHVAEAGSGRPIAGADVQVSACGEYRIDMVTNAAGDYRSERNNFTNGQFHSCHEARYIVTATGYVPQLRSVYASPDTVSMVEYFSLVRLLYLPSADRDHPRRGGRGGIGLRRVNDRLRHARAAAMAAASDHSMCHLESVDVMATRLPVALVVVSTTGVPAKCMPV